VSIYSTFLQRSFDQLIHDVAIQALPVTICIDRAGLVGDDGKTHQGVFDITYTRCIPNMTVSAPKDENELQHLLWTAIGSGRPWAIRYPRGLGLGVALDATLREIPAGRGEIVREGKDACFLAYGSMVPVAVEASAALAARGIACGVAHARFAKPLDFELLDLESKMAPRILTVEEHLAAGGFGSAVLEAFHERGLDASGVRVHAVPDQFVEHSPQALQRRNFKLDSEGLAERLIEIWPELTRGGDDNPLPRETGEDEKLAETVSW
jgi:1-deoxy-D-xylulose-5-phosphate synthase